MRNSSAQSVVPNPSVRPLTRDPNAPFAHLYFYWGIVRCTQVRSRDYKSYGNEI